MNVHSVRLDLRCLIMLTVQKFEKLTVVLKFLLIHPKILKMNKNSMLQDNDEIHVVEASKTAIFLSRMFFKACKT